MNKTKIEWCDSTWNPVTGCLHGCEYCYARSIANRFAGHWSEERLRSFGANGKIHDLEKPMSRHTTGKNRSNPSRPAMAPYPFGFDATFHRYRLAQPTQKVRPQNIFVCSMADLFGDWVPDEWIQAVFKACGAAPQHRYLFLTKNPDRYYQLGDGDENIIPGTGISGWFGASATTEQQAQAAWENLNCSWMSLEPLHGSFGEDFFTYDDRYTQRIKRRWDWIVIGAETGNRKGKVIPKREWIDKIVNCCERWQTPLFMKDSLIPIIGEENMRREFPWEASHD